MAAVKRAVALVVLLAGAATTLFTVDYFDLDDSYAGVLLAFGSLSVLSILLLPVMRRRSRRSSPVRDAETATVAPAAESLRPSQPSQPSPVTAAGAAPAAPARRRGYMGEEKGWRPARDYMGRQLAEPAAALGVPPPTPAEEPASSPAEPSPVAETPPPESDPPHEERPSDEAGAPPERGDPARREFPSGEFIPFEPFEDAESEPEEEWIPPPQAPPETSPPL